ncbi:MAG: archaeosortase/exosortase family protein, partial [Patescibacteria group bacterium]
LYNLTFFHGYVQNTSLYPIILIYPLILLVAFTAKNRGQKIQKMVVSFSSMLFFSFLALSVGAIPIGYLVSHNIPVTFANFFLLYLADLFLFLAIFGVRFAKSILQEFVLVVNILMGFLLSAYFIETQWKFFSYGILYALQFLLPFVSKGATVNFSNFHVRVDGFTAVVGAPCAGFYSIVLFVIFFLFSLYLLKQKHAINRGRAMLVFCLGLVVLFFVNVVRIGIIILIGGFISPTLAVSFFHTYLASFFFLAFLFVYLWYVMPKLIKNKKSP